MGCIVGAGVTSARAAVPSAGKPAETSPWKWGASAAVKESFDSNVYLQSMTELANQASWVTSVQPLASGGWSSAPFSAKVQYTPEWVTYHAERSEDFIAHRANADLSYQGATATVDLTGSLVLIDGESLAPTYSGPGGAPATGGPAVRDRRDATVYRASGKYTQALGSWLMRPGFTFYEHDFRTVQMSRPGYQNYVDRKEFTVGADVGRPVIEKLPVWLGYRYGEQNQAPLLGYPEEYDSRFHRVLFGLEGPIASWLKASISLGPEFRTYGDRVPASFGDHDVLNLFVDATVTVTPGKNDTVVLSAREFEQPGFLGRAAYEDLTFDLTWRHRFGTRWTIGVGARAYNTDFLEPAVRNDWVYAIHGLVNWAVTPKLGIEASYVYEDGETRDSNAAAREYDRHLVALGLKYTFH